jgi:hypothetical protein
VLSGSRRGDSWPIVVETRAGQRLVKLRGAAQGTGPLVAEIIVAGLAEALDLHVPGRSLVTLAGGTPTDDRNDEFGDLLSASAGLNLGFEILAGAREFTPEDIEHVPPIARATVLWLDRLTLNPDRTRSNPNLLWCKHRMVLIDHGAALRFQYDWASVTDASARTTRVAHEEHLFESAAGAREWPEWDEAFAHLLTPEVLELVVSEVPEEFLAPMMPESEMTPGGSTRVEALDRRRADYVSFLSRRLEAPRAFINTTPELLPRSVPRGKPGWLERR